MVLPAIVCPVAVPGVNIPEMPIVPVNGRFLIKFVNVRFL
jgi:hypothetical protein